MSDGRSLLEIGLGDLSTNSGPKKPVGFFTVSGRGPLGVKSHRRTQFRFVGIPKGPPFGASFSILSVRAESMAVGDTSSQSPLCLGLPLVALDPLPCSSFPQQTHFVGLCRGPLPAGQRKNGPRRASSLRSGKIAAGALSAGQRKEKNGEGRRPHRTCPFP